jgi:tetratricopeptide (TPR) repeat protein
MRRYDQTLSRARALYEAGNLLAAEEIYRKLLRQLPDDTLAMHNLSVILFAQGRRWEANRLITKVLNLNNDFPEYFATMAAFLEDPAFSQEMQNSWGGPFNGQPMRREIFLQIVARTRPVCILETGTYRASTTDFMATATDLPVLSSESNIINFHFARRRVGHLPNVSLFHMDSRAFLQSYVPICCRADTTTFFYLDAHWAEDLPLAEELAIVFELAPRSVVMIDDFQVPDDPGYTFDDYGPGRRLSLDYLEPLARYRPHYFFPGPSEREGGHRRGCTVVTLDPALAGALDQIPDLRTAPATA